MKLNKKLKVGISLFVHKNGQSLWENGIFQNCLFLAILLKKSPIVDSVFLVAGGGDGDSNDAMKFIQDSPVEIIDMFAAMENLDLMIEMSAQLPKQWIIDFKSLGRKVVSMRVGNDYVIDIERFIFDKSPALLIHESPYDEIWTLAEYKKICSTYYENIFRAPVRIVPHLWSPIIIKKAIENYDKDVNFKYKPQSKRWNLGMFEPNVCMVKTSYIPLLICEEAHRKNPNFIQHIYACNTYGLREHNVFHDFSESLDVVKHGITSFEGRYPLWQVLSMYCDVVISHQWENAQNYVYYEALYGGYPLIHNSDLIDDCGYRYHDFDCIEGGQILLSAYNEHDHNIDNYSYKAKRFLKKLDPELEDNIIFYTKLIKDLYE